MDAYNIGKTIRDLRAERQYSQAQLGELLHITDSAVSKWESGDSNPNIEQIGNLANLFSMTVDDFLHYQEQKNAEQLQREAEEKARLAEKNQKIKDQLNNGIFIKAWDQEQGYCDEARITCEYDGTTLSLYQKENPNIVLYDSCVGSDVQGTTSCSVFRDGAWEQCPYFETYTNRWRILFDFTHPVEKIRFSFDEAGIEDYEFGVRYVAADKEAWLRKMEEENRKKLVKTADVSVFADRPYGNGYLKKVNVFFNAVSDSFSYGEIELYYYNLNTEKANLLKTYRLNDGEKIWMEDKICDGFHFILKQYDAENRVIFQSDMTKL